MSDITLWQGDCLELMKDIPDKSIDLILCDLPYGTTQCKWDTILPFDALWENYHRIISDTGVVALFGAEPFSSQLRNSNLSEFRYDWYWIKDRPSGHLNAKIQPLRDVEIISIFYGDNNQYFPQMSVGKPSHSIGRAINDVTCKNNNLYGDFARVEREGNLKYPRQTLYYTRPHPPIHPTQKPVELMEYLIWTYTQPGNTVLDNCMGSGTTGVACKKLNRNFIGIELDPKYFELAKERIEKSTFQTPLFLL